MILILDGDPHVGRGLSRLFNAAGYGSCSVATEAEAIGIIRSHPAGTPLLLMLDDGDPDIAATEVLEALRSNAATRPTPVILHGIQCDDHPDGPIARAASAFGVMARLPKGGSQVPDTFKAVVQWYERAGGARRGGGAGMDKAIEMSLEEMATRKMPRRGCAASSSAG